MADDSSDEYFAAFGALAAVFKPLGDDSTPYLSLLHLHHKGTAAVIELIHNSTCQPNATAGIENLLRDSNWRPHLVGAVAAYFFNSAEIIAEAWLALDTGSWVTPQLAAILSLIDEYFVDHSISRLQNGCPLIRNPEDFIADPLLRHVSQGPADEHERSAKAAASLVALLGADHPIDERVRDLAAMCDLNGLIATDFDGSGEIALVWRESFQGLVN